MNLTDEKLFKAANINDLETAQDIVENDYVSTPSVLKAVRIALNFNSFDVLKFIIEHYDLFVDEKYYNHIDPHNNKKKIMDYLKNRIRLQKLKLLDKTV